MQNYNSKLKNLKKLLENSIVFLATANKVGNPNIAAAEVNKITADWEIIITNNQLRKTVENIITTKRAAILFIDNKKYGGEFTAKQIMTVKESGLIL